MGGHRYVFITKGHRHARAHHCHSGRAGTLILILATLSVNGTTLQSFQTLDQQARAQDKGFASTSPQPCANPRLQVNAPIRVLWVSQTETIRTQVTNQDTIECDMTLSLVAPDFRLQPADNQRLLQLEPTESGTVTWNVTPMSVGHFTLAITAGNAAEQIGINVVSANGIIPLQPQTLDYLAIFFGFLLAVVSLLAWQWWTRERRHRTPRRTETASTPSSVAGDRQIGPQPVP
jgi:hypothetical protein